MFGDRITRLVSSFSFLLAFSCASWAGDMRELIRQVDAAPTLEAKKTALRNAPRSLWVDERYVAPTIEAAIEYDNPESWQECFDLIELQKQAINGFQASPTSPTEQTKQIKRNPLFVDNQLSGSNWIERALSRIRMPQRDNKEEEELKGPQIGGINLSWVIPLVWVLLGIAIAVFLFFVIRAMRIKQTLARKAKALLEDDEPLRTVDEWLTLSNEHIASGNHRLAIRCLYLACLLRFDEFRIARFDRGQTNWEHLARIDSSARKPGRIDFRPLTQAFDQFWYGFAPCGVEDSRRFQTAYQEIYEILRAEAA